MRNYDRKSKISSRPVGSLLVPWTAIGIVGVGLSQGAVIVLGIVQAGSAARGAELAFTALSILACIALAAAIGLHAADRNTLLRDRALAERFPLAWKTISAKEIGWRDTTSRIPQLRDVSSALYFSATVDEGGLRIWTGGKVPIERARFDLSDITNVRSGFIGRSFRQIPTVWIGLDLNGEKADLPLSLNEPGRLTVKPQSPTELESRLESLREALARARRVGS